MQIIKILSLITLLYILIIIIAYSMQTNFIFYPKKLHLKYKFDDTYKKEEFFITTNDGEKINALFFPNNSNKVILYFHGNAGSLDSWQYIYDSFKSLEYNFFIFDYRGYGKSTGKISEKGLYLDGQAAFNFLLKKGFKKDEIIIYGRSIGTGIAVEIADKNKINSLILETPFTNLKKLANEKAPYLLPRISLKYTFDNIGKINNINIPFLIIHGKKDNLIPFKHGEQIYNEYKGKKQFLIIEEGEHNNLDAFPEFTQGISLFLNQVNNSETD
ncbi:MAG: alpha/beta hydrolase [Bacteroidales bacterium]|nr:alpha/beta hydrolase [Bacteroidales bacterium]